MDGRYGTLSIPGAKPIVDARYPQAGPKAASSHAPFTRPVLRGLALFQQGSGHVDHVHQGEHHIPRCALQMGAGFLGGGAAQRNRAIALVGLLAGDTLAQGPQRALQLRWGGGGVEVEVEGAAGGLFVEICFFFFRIAHDCTYEIRSRTMSVDNRSVCIIYEC
jgi:hypothetical protein